MNTYGVYLMGRRRRRRHSVEFKAAVIRECMRPGVSIAAVALAHRLNANMLRKWVIDAEQAGVPAQPVAAAPEEVNTVAELRPPRAEGTGRRRRHPHRTASLGDDGQARLAGGGGR